MYDSYLVLVRFDTSATLYAKSQPTFTHTLTWRLTQNVNYLVNFYDDKSVNVFYHFGSTDHADFENSEVINISNPSIITQGKSIPSVHNPKTKEIVS